jgi:hypothetical protein
MRESIYLPREQSAIGATARLGAWLVAIGLLAGNASADDPPPGLARENLIAVLKHREGTVRSVESLFEIRTSATRREMIPLMKDQWRSWGDEKQALGYLYSTETARANSHVIRWSRRGNKERVEKARLETPDRVITTEAFDGHVLRGLSMDGSTPNGSIHSAAASGWLTIERPHPYTFQYMFGTSYYSELIAAATDLHIAREMEKNKALVLVRFSKMAKGVYDYKIELRYDDVYRLVEQRVLENFGEKFGYVIRQINRYSDFQSHPNPYGESIWFPHRIIQNKYLGRHPSGQLVETHTEGITIREIRFNVDIPEEKFTLTFPTEARVWDGVTGHNRLLPPGVRPVEVFSKMGRPWWHWAALTGGVGLALVTTLTVYRRWRRATA